MKKNTVKIKAVLLDIGGVVVKIDWNLPFLKWGVPPPPKELFLWDIYDVLERGRIEFSEFQRGVEQELGQKFDPLFFLQGFNSIICHELPGIGAYLEKLQNQIPLYALSNISTPHLEVLDTFSVFRCFRKIFASCHMDSRKPNLEIYRKTLAELGLSPEEVLFIDDRMPNVEAARILGLKAEQCENDVEKMKAIVEAHL